nr:MAG TPA: hypothetical protein [Bacteriophage sp.]
MFFSWNRFISCLNLLYFVNCHDWYYLADF